MSVFVKICGLTSEAEVQAVSALQPDAIGFVFWPSSKRAVKADEVAVWTREIPPAIKRVGVFVNVQPEEVLRTMEQANLNIAQLHGAEQHSDFVNFPRALWRAVRISPGSLAIPPAGWSVDAYLLDTYSAASPGGTGEVGDWEAARHFVAHSPYPVLLAGGLTPGNVRDALKKVRPWGADVSSGVEGADGKKDIEKVRKFIEQCREK